MGSSLLSRDIDKKVIAFKSFLMVILLFNHDFYYNYTFIKTDVKPRGDWLIKNMLFYQYQWSLFRVYTCVKEIKIPHIFVFVILGKIRLISAPQGKTIIGQGPQARDRNSEKATVKPTMSNLFYLSYL